MKWQLYVSCLRRFFLSSNTHFHSTLSIYGSIWLNFGMVPTRPSLSWILFYFNKTKTEVPEVLKMNMCRVLYTDLTHICYNILTVSMTSLEAIKKGVPIRPYLWIMLGGHGEHYKHQKNWGKLELLKWMSYKNTHWKAFKPCTYNIYIWLLVPIALN